MVFIFTGVFEIISSSGAFRFLVRLFDTGVSKPLSLSSGTGRSISNFGFHPDFIDDSSCIFEGHEGEDGVGGKSTLNKIH